MNQPPLASARTATQVNRPNTAHRPERKVLGQTIDQQILLAVSGGFEQHIVRQKFIQMLVTELGAIGACYLAKTSQDHWLPIAEQPKIGRLPDWQQLAESHSEFFDTAASSPRVQHVKFSDDAPVQSALVVGVNSGMQSELFFVAFASTTSVSTQAVRLVQKLASALQLWLNGKSSQDIHWQVESLSFLVELVTAIEQRRTLKEATEELANQLSSRWQCESVAVGINVNGKLKLQAISGAGDFDSSSDTSRDYKAALMECQLRNESGIFPPPDKADGHLLQAHRQLVSGLNCEAVFSMPLQIETAQPMGALIFTGNTQLMQSDQMSRFASAAAPAISSALQVVQRAQISRLRRLSRSIGRTIKKPILLFTIAMLIGLGMLMTVPVTYRVRCHCVSEPVTRRFAVAPFAGQIVKGYAEAGDYVQAGAVLAELDGKEIAWELAAIVAKKHQSAKSRQMELSEGNIPQSVLADLESRRLQSEESVLRYKQDSLFIKSPIEGVVLSGSTERREAASVSTGDVLYEIGPIQPLRMELNIPADEMAMMKEGQTTKIWVEGFEEKPISGVVARIHPRSETRDAANVFVAEVEFANEDRSLRPGMHATARIDCDQVSLGWALFHKPLNYLRTRLTWW